ERRAASDLRLDRDVTAHQASEPPRNREADAEATVRARAPAVELAKRLEDAFVIFRRNADAGVAHLEANGFGTDVSRDRDRAFAGEFHRVADQVRENHAHLRR